MVFQIQKMMMPMVMVFQIALKNVLQQERYLAEWDDMPYGNLDPSNSYTLPDGTGLTVSITANGASIAAAGTNTNLQGGYGGGTVGLFLNGNQNLKVNSIDASFKFDQAVDSLEFEIFDVDFNAGQFVDSLIIVGYLDGYIVFPDLTASVNNTASSKQSLGNCGNS